MRVLPTASATPRADTSRCEERPAQLAAHAQPPSARPLPGAGAAGGRGASAAPSAHPRAPALPRTTGGENKKGGGAGRRPRLRERPEGGLRSASELASPTFAPGTGLRRSYRGPLLSTQDRRPELKTHYPAPPAASADSASLTRAQTCSNTRPQNLVPEDQPNQLKSAKPAHSLLPNRRPQL